MKIIFVFMFSLLLSCTSPTEKETAQVYMNKGAVQCESSGLSKEESAQRLIDNGIDVLKSECGQLTGVAFATVCGGATGDINLHTIVSQNLLDAERLGYESIADLAQDSALGFIVIECAP